MLIGRVGGDDIKRLFPWTVFGDSIGLTWKKLMIVRHLRISVIVLPKLLVVIWLIPDVAYSIVRIDIVSSDKITDYDYSTNICSTIDGLDAKNSTVFESLFSFL